MNTDRIQGWISEGMMLAIPLMVPDTLYLDGAMSG